MAVRHKPGSRDWRQERTPLLEPPEVRVDWARATPIHPAKICQCSRDALVHEEYMTSFMQDTRQCRLRIERLWQDYDGKKLVRTILLVDEFRFCHVLAEITIMLCAFPPALKRSLIESDLPFGMVLHGAGIRVGFHDRQYFRLPATVPGLRLMPYRRCCAHYFGRFHEMTDQYGTRLAAVYEALP